MATYSHLNVLMQLAVSCDHVTNLHYGSMLSQDVDVAVLCGMAHSELGHEAALAVDCSKAIDAHRRPAELALDITQEIDAAHLESLDQDVSLALTIDADEYHSVPSLDRYELFHSTTRDGFNFDSPDETFASLPHTTTLTYGDGEHFFVVRKRNPYNHSSQNRLPTRIFVDSGDAATPPPTAPVEYSVDARANLVYIDATYLPDADGESKATSWIIYAKVGSAPVIGVDSPVVVAMTGIDIGPVLLHYNPYPLVELGDGETVYAIVRTRRGTTDSVNTEVVSGTTSHDEPIAPPTLYASDYRISE